jgi:moderate conductance mechanosensitive channel
MVGLDETPFTTAEWWRHYGWALAITLLIPLVVSFVSRRWRRVVLRRSKAAGDDPEGRRLRRVTTVVGLLSGAIIVLAWFVFVLVLLAAVNVNIAPLIASAGIAGIALGFGAQTLVRDFLSGLFMFIEDQYGVGDVIDVGLATGTVEALSLRTTRLRDVDGVVWHVPNGEVHRVGNMSQLWARALIDVPIRYDADIDAAIRVIEEAANALRRDEELGHFILDEPDVLGVESLSSDNVVIRVVVRTQPQQQARIERALRARIKLALDEAGISVPSG